MKVVSVIDQHTDSRCGDECSSPVLAIFWLVKLKVAWHVAAVTKKQSYTLAKFGQPCIISTAGG